MVLHLLTHAAAKVEVDLTVRLPASCVKYKVIHQSSEGDSSSVLKTTDQYLMLLLVYYRTRIGSFHNF